VDGRVLCRSNRVVIGRVFPGTAEQVAQVVREATTREWPTHAVSTGMNWGMGSYLPAEDGRLIIDLSQLTEIGPIDRCAGTVRIEAGVTQRQLFDWLEANADEFAFNVTGASERTSVVGNAMQRGLGYDGSRADEIFGHEVVKRDGSWHRPDKEWFSTVGSIPVGPRFDALWSQSEYGIVTAGWLRLRRKQPLELAVVISGEWEALFATVQAGYRRNLLSLPTHMAGNQRASLVGRGLLWRHQGREPSADEVARVIPQTAGHTAIAALRGEAIVVKATLKALRKLRVDGTVIKAISSRKIEQGIRWAGRLGLRNKADFLKSIRPLLGLTWGEPSEAGMAALQIAPDEDPDQAKQGVVYFNAVSAVDRQQSQQVETLVRASFPQCSLTRVFQSTTELVHVFSVEFSNESTEVTHQRLLEIGHELRALGFPPYRLGSVRPGGLEDLWRDRGRAILGELIPVPMKTGEGA